MRGETRDRKREALTVTTMSTARQVQEGKDSRGGVGRVGPFRKGRVCKLPSKAGRERAGPRLTVPGQRPAGARIAQVGKSSSVAVRPKPNRPLTDEGSDSSEPSQKSQISSFSCSSASALWTDFQRGVNPTRSAESPCGGPTREAWQESQSQHELESYRRMIVTSVRRDALPGRARCQTSIRPDVPAARRGLSCMELIQGRHLPIVKVGANIPSAQNRKAILRTTAPGRKG